MSNDSPPGSSPPEAGGEFTWPPTREELDAIQVIPLDDTSSIKQIAVAPARAMVAPAIKRRGRLRLGMPRRDDLVFGGVVATSVLAIAVAASMQFSDLWRTPSQQIDPPIEPVSTTALPSMPSIAAAPLAALAMPATSAMNAVSALPAAPRDVVSARSARTGVGSRAAERRRLSASRSARTAAYARRAGHTPVSRAGKRRATASAPALPAAFAKSPTRLPEDEDDTRPRLISPERGRSGKVVLWVEVRKNGKVGDVDVLSSNLDRDNRSHRDLQRAAVSTVKRWRYEPAIRDGEPADTHVRVVVNIDLDSGAARLVGPASGADARRRGAAANRAADSVRAAR